VYVGVLHESQGLDGTRSHVDMECSKCWLGFPFFQRRTCGRSPMRWRLHESCSLTTNSRPYRPYTIRYMAAHAWRSPVFHHALHIWVVPSFMHSPALRGIPTSFLFSFHHLRHAQVKCTVKQALSLALDHLRPRPTLTALLFQLVCPRP
jgi:hypothetical protein